MNFGFVLFVQLYVFPWLHGACTLEGGGGGGGDTYNCPQSTNPIHSVAT